MLSVLGLEWEVISDSRQDGHLISSASFRGTGERTAGKREGGRKTRKSQHGEQGGERMATDVGAQLPAKI